MTEPIDRPASPDEEDRRQLQAYVRRAVDNAPPLTPENKARVIAIMRDAGRLLSESQGGDR